MSSERHEVPSRQETERRAATDRGAYRDLILDWLTGLTVLATLVGLAIAIAWLARGPE